MADEGGTGHHGNQGRYLILELWRRTQQAISPAHGSLISNVRMNFKRLFEARKWQGFKNTGHREHTDTRERDWRAGECR
jgi:hypothetical protein